jgi:hypothetical protein
MTSKTLMLSVNAAICLFCAIPRDAYAWASLYDGADTHKDITKDVLRNFLADQPLVLADYPDLVMFGDPLRDGSNQESHNIPDGIATELWMPKPGEAELWFTAGKIFEPAMEYGARWAYTNYFFQSAYTRIGYELHLVQDTFVPAHKNYCFHGIPNTKVDRLEAVASANHAYATTTTPWSYNYQDQDGYIYEFQYWLSDSMDDDNRDDDCIDDEQYKAGEIIPDGYKAGDLIPDGPNAYGVMNTAWGTYGQPQTDILSYNPFKYQIHEELPGRNEGIDYFASAPKLSIIDEQLQKAYVATLDRLKLRSEELPPLIPDDNTNGKPNISLKIFGPNKPVEISFVAMENRKPTVFVYVLAGTAGGIMDYNSFKVLDGGANSTRDLLPWDVLPWKSQIICKWTGDTATGQIADGDHVITMQVKDQNENLSEKRTRSVKFDKTKPTGTITITGLPQSSNS